MCERVYLPLDNFGIELPEAGTFVENEVDPKLGLVEVVKHDERSFGYRVDVKAQSPVWSFRARVNCKEIVDDPINRITFFRNDGQSESVNALSK
jgi:hypothetical protein